MATPRPSTSESLEQEDYSSVDLADIESGSDCSSSTCQQPAAVVSLLDRLRQAPKAAANRKWKIAQNLPRDRKRNKGPRCMSEPKSVTVSQRVKEYPSEAFTVSANKLFCSDCREEVSIKKSVITLHIQSEKHSKGKAQLQSKSKREQDIVKALLKYDEEMHPVGETLPGEQRVYRVKVVSTFLKAGVPIAKMDHFRPLLEERGYCLAERKPMSDLIPFILGEEKQQIRKEIDGKDVSVIFDGTCRLGEALTVVLRFVDENFSVQQRVVRVQLLAKSLSGEEIARELISTLSTELGVTSGRLLASMRDRASCNNVAMRTLKVAYPNVLDIGCYSHAIP